MAGPFCTASIFALQSSEWTELTCRKARSSSSGHFFFVLFMDMPVFFQCVHVCIKFVLTDEFVSHIAWDPENECDSCHVLRHLACSYFEQSCLFMNGFMVHGFMNSMAARPHLTFNSVGLEDFILC